MKAFQFLSQTAQSYFGNFKGFTREIWILTFVTFINRAGTMVLPFLSKYLKEDLHFSYSQIGTIMVFFGLGSMLGSWLGGKLTDKIGFYKVMVFSLFTSGLAFWILKEINTFYGFCAGIFIVMAIADMFRPAMFVSIGAYAKPENRTRALTLVRLAVNLGFAAGPALGGLLIMKLGYKMLFWIDGLTCIVSILFFAFLVKEKKNSIEKNETVLSKSKVIKDAPFWIFLITCVITGILFFQLFTTIPIYQKEQFNLTEFQTGLLMTLNGLLVFFLEMPIVSLVEKKHINKAKMVAYGCLGMTLSMAMLLLNFWSGIFVIMMILFSFSEMFAFPFSNSFALSRAPKGQEGRYMAVFTMSYSLAHILSGKIGMNIVQNYSYQTNWVFMTGLGFVGTILGFWVLRMVKEES